MQRTSYTRAFADLFSQLPPVTRLTVVTQTPAVDTLGALLAAADIVDRTSVLLAPADMAFSVWAQDPYLVLEEAGQPPTFLQPRFFQRQDDAGLATVFAGDIRQSQLCFQGGHVLAGDDFVLVGRDCRDATLAELGPDVDVDALFAAELGDRRIVFVGTDREVPEETIRPCADAAGRLEAVYRGAGDAQPLDHLDMFISLAGRDRTGRYRLLVGSPALADELLGRPSPDHTMQDVYDDIADRLVAQGFEVIRNPLPLTYGDGRRSVDGTIRDVRLWYHASANNCLVQIDSQAGNHVWLPTYGHGAWQHLAVTDAANQAVWEGLGFTVHALANYHAFAQRLGAVHCIAKDLAR